MVLVGRVGPPKVGVGCYSATQQKAELIPIRLAELSLYPKGAGAMQPEYAELKQNMNFALVFTSKMMKMQDSGVCLGKSVE